MKIRKAHCREEVNSGQFIRILSPIEMTPAEESGIIKYLGQNTKKKSYFANEKVLRFFIHICEGKGFQSQLETLKG